MGLFIQPEDLEAFATIEEAKATEMIADAEAMATLSAPCLPGLTESPEGETPAQEAVRLAKLAAVKAVLRGAILRWDDAGTGGTASETEQQTQGPFSQSTTSTFVSNRRSLFWPSEINDLQSICSDGEKGKAFDIDTIPDGPKWMEIHSNFCNLRFGANWCSCGADIAGWPLFYPIENENNEE